MTKPKSHVPHPTAADVKREAQRRAERIVIPEHQRKHCNSTTRGQYIPHELEYRGK